MSAVLTVPTDQTRPLRSPKINLSPKSPCGKDKEGGHLVAQVQYGDKSR